MNRKSLTGIVALSLFILTIAAGAKNACAQESPVLQIEELHPAFRLSAVQVEQAIKRGQDMAQRKKKFEDVLAINGQKPKGVKGEGGKSHESLVVCYSLDALDFVLDAYNAASTYDPVKVPEDIRQHGTYGTVLKFAVMLVSAPKLGANAFDRDRFAKEGDVKVVKFAVTDDRGNILQPLETNTVDSQSGTVGFSGYNVIPHTVSGSSTSTTYASAYGSDGSSAYGTASTYGKSSYSYNEYEPWTQSHPYYMALYKVNFPLFGADGKPLITAATKSLTLHIVTETGERVVEYKLPKPKK